MNDLFTLYYSKLMGFYYLINFKKSLIVRVNRVNSITSLSELQQGVAVKMTDFQRKWYISITESFSTEQITLPLSKFKDYNYLVSNYPELVL